MAVRLKSKITHLTLKLGGGDLFLLLIHSTAVGQWYKIMGSRVPVLGLQKYCVKFDVP
jgi:hypothetical protein